MKKIAIVKNVFAQYTSQIASALFAILFIVYASRILGPESFGRWSVIVTLVTFFINMVDFGVSPLITREVARNPSQAGIYSVNAAVLLCGLGIVAYGLAIGTGQVMKYPRETEFLIILASLTIIPRALVNVFSALINAFERMEIPAGLAIFFNGVNALGGLAVLHYGLGLRGYFSLLVLSSMANLLIIVLIVHRAFAKLSLSFSLFFSRDILKRSFPYGAMALLSLLYARANILILSKLEGEHVVGLFAASSNLLDPFKFIIIGLNTALFPIMSRFHAESSPRVKTTHERFIKYLFTIALPITIGLTILSERIVFLVFGDQYKESISLLRVLSWSLLFSFIHAPNALFFLTSNMISELLWLSAICASVSIILNALFIYFAHLIGSGIAAVLSDMFSFGLLYISVLRHTKSSGIPHHLFRPVLCGVIMGVYVMFFKEINLALLILTSACLYAALLYILGAFSDDDRRLLRELAKEVRSRF